MVNEFQKGNAKHVPDLPIGFWQVASYKDLLIFVSPVHAPRVLQDGEVTRLNPIALPFSSREH